MASILSFHTALFPPPLHISKPRRTTYRRFLPRKSYYQFSQANLYGPLDDIIDKIADNISHTPAEHCELSFLDWANPLKASSAWTVTPLPVSRIPSDQPLTIRKNRSSRSTASDSSMDGLPSSRNSSHKSGQGGSQVGPSANLVTTPFPPLEPFDEYNVGAESDISVPSAGTDHTSAQQALTNVIDHAERPQPTKRRISNMVKDGLSRLRGNGNGNGEAALSGRRSSSSPPPTTTSAAKGDDSDDSEPAEDAVHAYTIKNALNGARLGSLIGRVSKGLPSPLDYRHEDIHDRLYADQKGVYTTLKPAVRVHSEVKLLTEDRPKEFWIAIEVEGVLHNRKLLADPSIDVIFVVDNGYYVTKECLTRAIDAATGGLYHLDRGDRVALYMTHCTHKAVTGTVPDMVYPMRPYNKDTEEIFRDVANEAKKHGTQAWHPPRPNPPMAEVILAVMRSLESQNLRSGRSHVIVLSPAAHVLHEVSKSYPDLLVHRINSAVLPFKKDPTRQECADPCCQNVFTSNWTHYQSVPNRIKNIMQHGRFERSLGDITKLHIDLKPKKGCEILELKGTKNINCLRLGQVHTMFARISVLRSGTAEIDMDSQDSFLSSSLDVNNHRQDIRNARARGATKAHVLSVQIMYQDSLHPLDTWNFKESQLLILKELGGLAPPMNTADEVYKRQYFHNFSQLPAALAKVYADNLIAAIPKENEQTKRLLERMGKEIIQHRHILDYENNCRQSLPTCPGPIDVEAAPHEWLAEKWDKKKIHRKGVAIAQKQLCSLELK